MDTPSDEIFPDEYIELFFGTSTDTLSPAEEYLQMIKQELALDEHKLTGDPEFWGHEFHDGKWYNVIGFSVEGVGCMKKLYPVPQGGTDEELSET